MTARKRALARAVLAAGLCSRGQRARMRKRRSRSASCCPTPEPTPRSGAAIENGFQPVRAGAGRQARRARDRVLQGRRRVRAVEGRRQRQQADQARQRRRASSAPCTRASSMAMAKVAKDTSTLLDRSQRRCATPSPARCARRNIFRSSFSNWQPGLRDGQGRSRARARRRSSTITWKYAAGDESVQGLQGRHCRRSAARS